MRIEKSVTAISWIPSEAIEGLPKVPFELGIGHYDEPPPDRLEAGDLSRVRADRGRARRLPGPAARARQAVLPRPRGDRVDDARAHDPGRRLLRARAGR